MNAAHANAADLCVDEEDVCVNTTEWTPAVAEANCPDGYGNGGDKGYGTAKICRENLRLDDGYYEYADVLYAESFNLTLANFVYWACSATCMYDIAHLNDSTVMYNW